jgi:hypothetical protein
MPTIQNNALPAFKSLFSSIFPVPKPKFCRPKTAFRSEKSVKYNPRETQFLQTNNVEYVSTLLHLFAKDGHHFSKDSHHFSKDGHHFSKDGLKIITLCRSVQIDQFSY